jgi:hypothetical protein
MDRTDLQRLSREELIELVLQLQRPNKTSRTSSMPPSTDKKEKRENSRPGGAKPGHEPHNRRLADSPDGLRDHKPVVCARCGGAFAADADMTLIGEYDEIEIPPVSNYPPLFRGVVFRSLGLQASVATMTLNGLAPLSLAVSMVVRTSASACAAHIAR